MMDEYFRFQIVLNLSLENTQKKLDKALKRNLDKSNDNINQKIQKDSTTKDTPEAVGNEDNQSLDNENVEE